jgi:hypothetical protein
LNPVVDPAAPSGWETQAADEQTQVSPAVNADTPSAPPASDPIKAEQAIEPTGDPVELLQESQPGAPTTSWSWGQTASSGTPDDEPIAKDVSDAFDPGDPAVTAPDDASESQSLSSWASQWSGLSANEPGDNDVASESEAAAPEPPVDSAAESDDEASPEVAIGENDGERDEVSEPGIAISDEADDDVIEPVAPATIYSDEELDAAAVGEEDRLPVDGSPQARAHALLDELRELFDASAKEQEPEPAPAAGTSAKENDDTAAALATLTAIPSDASRFDNLRAILEKAREHPRDVDTMLDLLGEINSLIALIDSHETHVDAVKTAIAQLRGEEE